MVGAAPLMPLKVVMTGISSIAASLRASALHPDSFAPLPSHIVGLRALFRRRAASSIRRGSPLSLSRFLASNRPLSARFQASRRQSWFPRTSRAKSIRTGPGHPVVARMNASSMTCGIVFPSSTSFAHFTKRAKNGDMVRCLSVVAIEIGETIIAGDRDDRDLNRGMRRRFQSACLSRRVR